MDHRNQSRIRNPRLLADANTAKSSTVKQWPWSAMGSRCARGAQALGISENVLHRWKREARDSQSNSELEVEKLRQRLKQVEMERDILKKALSIFSRQT